MTPRPHARTRRAALALLSATAGLLALPGCDPRTLIYFLQPYEPTVPAPWPHLKGKKVVVLTNVAPSAQSDFPSLDRELTRELVTILRKNVKRIEIVDTDKVWAWVEAHPTWTDPAEAAKAFEADLVIFLEVTAFQIEDPRSPNMLEGTSNIHIQVFELAHPKNSRGKEITTQPKKSDKVYEDERDTSFPVRGPLPIGGDVTRPAFRNKFLRLVASEVSWHFIDHAPGDDIQEVKFNNNN